MIMQFEAGPKRCIKRWTMHKKSFRFGRLSLGYVVCFDSVFLFPVVFSVAFWSSFAYARTILYIYFLFLFTTKSDTFFSVAVSYKRLGVGER